MAYGETKVYFDGSHYIAIPHTTRPPLKRHKVVEEKIFINQEDEGSNVKIADEPSAFLENKTEKIENKNNEKIVENCQNNSKNTQNSMFFGHLTTRKEIFEDLYKKYITLSRKCRRENIIEKMLPYFKDRENCEMYVDRNLERKLRNLICRRVRMCRKANLANFNYFCTFTYDNKKHTEQSFRKGIKTCLRNLCYRKGWRYMGVWERAPETGRLHFHGLFNIPPNSMPGEIVEVKDYSTQFGKMQKTFQSTFFNKKFGRSDFKEIDENERRLGNALAYLMKYIEKTGEKIVYSKNLPQYFISDIMDNDVVCTIGQEDKKLLLFDDFKCWDEGVLMGNVSPQTISQMRKSN